MGRRRWLAVIVAVLLIGGAVAVSRLPELVRRVAVARIHAMTQRPVSIDRVDLDLLTGRASVHGFRLADRDGQAPLATFDRLDVRVRPASLLLGHLRIREVVVTDSTVHVVRLPDGTFNFSDLVGGERTPGRALDVTVEHFALEGGKVTLEDRALPEPRTWTSEQIVIDARDLSTRGARGRAVGRSMTAGAPVAIDLRDIRLHPIHLQGVVTIEGLDAALARVYLPPDAAVIPERGRVSSSVTVALDAREGLRADAAARLEDVVLTRPGGGEALARVAHMTTRVSGFAFAGGAVRLDRLAVEGELSLRDPTATPGRRFRLSSVRASVADLTWPATTPGRLELTTSIPGGGSLAVTGTLRPPPDATELRVRLASLDLAPWAQLLPIAARVTGVAEADLRINEPLRAGIPARVQGSIAVSRPRVADDRQELLAARRVEASGIALHWPAGGVSAREQPTRLVVERVLVSDPHGTLERDRSGAFPAKDLVTRAAPSTGPAGAGPARAAAVPSLAVDVGEIVVRNGAMAWRDQAVSPAARLDVAGIDARVTGIGWPLRGPANVRASLRPPGGGRLQLTGRVGLDPLDADVRVTARNAALAPYQPYLPTTARVAGAADLDVAVVVPSLAGPRAKARGRAALSRVDVRDGERTVLRVERAAATGIDVEWPARVAVERVALAQPWILVERDAGGGLALRSLLTGRTAPCRAEPCAAPASPGSEPVALTVAHLTVEGGGMRVVDQGVSPPFAVDLHSASVRLDGLSTGGPRPARLDLSGRLGPGAELRLRGTVGALGRPLHLDVNGELREFALPRTNPYLLRQVGWKSTDGRVTSTLQCRIDGDALAARTDIRLSRLQIVRAAAQDGAQARIGLPLGVLTALMKNRRGDINVTLPIGGRLGDPRFDFGEAVWGAVRAVAINAITLPVSWIGRVRFSQDSRIERIEIDPVAFQPGTPTLAAEGRAQLTRLAAFLDQLPEVRMALTPVVSSRDVEDLGRRALETALEQVARSQGLSREAAAGRLFAQRFADRPVPETPGAALAALLEGQTVPPAELTELGERRLEAVRATLKRAGIEGDRLAEMKVVEREGAGSRVDASVLEPEAPRPSKMREVLRRLGLPLKDSGADR